ncbi:hypothetical protein U91I_01480 [alpha proteobacterium U9-1i]|nr:hypothetical protein U91I_01480 [alpha proteobacterium U9-1i]
MGGQTISDHSAIAILIAEPSPVRALQLETMVRKAFSPTMPAVMSASSADAAQIIATKGFDLVILKAAPAFWPLADFARATNPETVIAWTAPSAASAPIGELLIEPIVYGDIVALAQRVGRRKSA